MEQSTVAAPAPAIVSVSDMISNVAAKTKIENTPTAAAPTVQIVRDAPALPLAAAPEAPAVTETPVADPAAPPTEPTGEIALDDADSEVRLSAQRNADGTFKSKLDPTEKLDFTIKDKTTGEAKAYSKTLPEVVRLAKDGITLQTKLQEVQPEVEYYRTSVPKWQQHTASLQEQLDAQKALNIELLTAEDHLVIERREQYKAEMAPEKQLERIKAERQAEQDARTQSARQQQHTKVAQSFVQSRIAPALAAAETAGLSKYAVAGLVTTLTNDLMVHGVIPPANWPEMERRINAPDGPFQLEVKAELAKRTQESDTVKAAREAAEAAAKKAQAVVNDQGRLMAPIGRSQGGEPQSGKSTQPNTVRSVIDRINSRPVPA